jgi:hypothetical protein
MLKKSRKAKKLISSLLVLSVMGITFCSASCVAKEETKQVVDNKPLPIKNPFEGTVWKNNGKKYYTTKQAYSKWEEIHIAKILEIERLIESGRYLPNPNPLKNKVFPNKERVYQFIENKYIALSYTVEEWLYLASHNYKRDLYRADIVKLMIQSEKEAAQWFLDNDFDGYIADVTLPLDNYLLALNQRTSFLELNRDYLMLIDKWSLEVNNLKIENFMKDYRCEENVYSSKENYCASETDSPYWGHSIHAGDLIERYLLSSDSTEILKTYIDFNTENNSERDKLVNRHIGKEFYFPEVVESYNEGFHGFGSDKTPYYQNYFPTSREQARKIIELSDAFLNSGMLEYEQEDVLKGITNFPYHLKDNPIEFNKYLYKYNWKEIDPFNYLTPAASVSIKRGHYFTDLNPLRENYTSFDSGEWQRRKFFVNYDFPKSKDGEYALETAEGTWGKRLFNYLGKTNLDQDVVDYLYLHDGKVYINDSTMQYFEEKGKILFKTSAFNPLNSDAENFRWQKPLTEWYPQLRQEALETSYEFLLEDFKGINFTPTKIPYTKKLIEFLNEYEVITIPERIREIKKVTFWVLDPIKTINQGFLEGDTIFRNDPKVRRASYFSKSQFNERKMEEIYFNVSEYYYDFSVYLPRARKNFIFDKSLEMDFDKSNVSSIIDGKISR